MTSLKLRIIAFICIAVGACATEKDFDCNSESATELLSKTLQDWTVNAVKTNLKKENITKDDSEIRAIASTIKIGFESIRTTKKDPSSSKRFCQATIKATFQDAGIVEFDELTKKVNLSSFAKTAAELELVMKATTVSSDIDFTTQPTDDKKQIFVETLKDSRIQNFISDYITLTSLKKNLEQNELAKKADEKSTQIKQAKEQSEKDSLEKAAIDIALSEAKSRLSAANQEINTIWNAPAKDFREKNLAEQKLWLKKRDVECKLNVKGDTDSEREISRLDCETSLTKSRSIYLKELILNG